MSTMLRAAMVTAVLAFLHMISLPTAAVAQVATGSIVGTVVDSSGQLVPGAQVTVREVHRNTTTTLTTDAAGVYTAPFLVPGTYDVSVELQGFKSWIRRGIVLQVNDRVRIDASLEVGTVTESTTVQAESPLVRTDSSEVGTVIEEVAVKELPLNGRNFATLVYLAPGITPGQAGVWLRVARGGWVFRTAARAGTHETRVLDRIRSKLGDSGVVLKQRATGGDSFPVQWSSSGSLVEFLPPGNDRSPLNRLLIGE
jgi:carboxypeptidase family protein